MPLVLLATDAAGEHVPLVVGLPEADHSRWGFLRGPLGNFAGRSAAAPGARARPTRRSRVRNRLDVCCPDMSEPCHGVTFGVECGGGQVWRTRLAASGPSRHVAHSSGGLCAPRPRCDASLRTRTDLASLCQLRARNAGLDGGTEPGARSPDAQLQTCGVMIRRSDLNSSEVHGYGRKDDEQHRDDQGPRGRVETERGFRWRESGHMPPPSAVLVTAKSHRVVRRSSVCVATRSSSCESGPPSDARLFNRHSQVRSSYSGQIS